MYIVFNQQSGQIVSRIIETTYEAGSFVKFYENLYPEYKNKNVIVVYVLNKSYELVGGLDGNEKK